MAPAFAGLLGGLINIAGTLTGRVLVAAGISVATFTGMDVSLTWLKDQALGSLSGLNAELLSLIAYMGVGQFLNIIFSAIVTRQLIDGITGGALKRWIFK